MVAVRAPGQAKNGAARIHIPVRRTHSGKGRHNVNAAVVFHFRGKIFGVTGITDQPQAVAQPLDHCPADKYASLHGIRNPVAHARRNGRQQSLFAQNRLIPNIHQGKAACAVCIFGVALFKARLRR